MTYGPGSRADGHDLPGLIDEAVPGLATVIKTILIGFELAVREPVVAQELPDILDRVQLRQARGQRHESDVGGHLEVRRGMSSSLIDDQGCMGAGP